VIQEHSQGGSWGARDRPFVSCVLSKQPTTGSKKQHENLVKNLVLAWCAPPPLEKSWLRPCDLLL